jgi:hypothetical protein
MTGQDVYMNSTKAVQFTALSTNKLVLRLIRQTTDSYNTNTGHGKLNRENPTGKYITYGAFSILILKSAFHD